MNQLLTAPFPYPGGKSRQVAREIAWGAMGVDVPTYIEPFCGSAAMLLGRPGGAGKYEVIGDASAHVANVWRALKNQQALVCILANNPPCEVDLIARAKRLRETDLSELLKSDIEACDPRLAADWIWCQSVSFSPDWLHQKTPPIHKPHRKGILSPNTSIESILYKLSGRLSRVSIAHGDWSRLVTPSALGFHNTGTTPTGIFADPPYPDETLDYGADPDTARRFEAWCRENGEDKRLRVVLCGHTGDYNLPGWTTVNWGGSRGWGRARRGENECFWLSPHCLKTAQQEEMFHA